MGGELSPRSVVSYNQYGGKPMTKQTEAQDLAVPDAFERKPSNLSMISGKLSSAMKRKETINNFIHR